MGISRYIKNGKIIKSKVEISMKLLKDEIIMIDRTYKQYLDSYKEINKFCERYDITEEENLELYIIHAKLCANRRELTICLANSLYSFFYGVELKEEEQEDDEEIIYYYHFPIDIKKFEKERIKQDVMEDLLKKNKDLFKEIYLYTQKNIKVFYKNLNF